MPGLDVSEVLFDPDFVTLGLLCTRSTPVVGANGIAVNTTTTTPFAGVVTSDKGELLERLATGQRVHGSITITTVFRLRDGGGGYAADIVTWLGAQYTVTDVKDYSGYGRGFVEATCELVPLGG